MPSFAETINAAVGRAVNRAADNAAARGPGSPEHKQELTTPAPPSAGAPVIIGDTVPSRLHLLRQGKRNMEPQEVALGVEERRRHVYVLGRTGVGKTELATTMFLADVAAGRGTVLVDMRGDLLDKALGRLAARFSPQEMRERLVLIDLRERAPFQPRSPAEEPEPVVGFNPLSEPGVDAYTRAFACLDVFQQQHRDAGIGVQTAETLRNVLLTLCMSRPGPGASWSLLEAERLLTCLAFRQRALAQVSDAQVLRFWTRFDALGPQQAQWVGPIVNRLSNWTSRPRLRRCFGQAEGVSFRRLFDERPDRVVLICLAADELGKANAGLLGMLLTTSIASAVMRADRTVYDRTQTTALLLDEFENVAGASGETLAEIISEGRRFGLALTALHQSTVQLDPKLRALIRNVVGTQIFFSVGGLDADQLAGELPSDEPRAALRTALLSLKVGEAMVYGPDRPLTRIRTRYAPDPPVDPARVAEMRQVGLARYGRGVAQIDAELDARERMYGTPASAGGPPTKSPAATPAITSVTPPESFEVWDDSDGTGGATPPRRRRGAGNRARSHGSARPAEEAPDA
jgi:hypothetical protein